MAPKSEHKGHNVVLADLSVTQVGDMARDAQARLELAAGSYRALVEIAKAKSLPGDAAQFGLAASYFDVAAAQVDAAFEAAGKVAPGLNRPRRDVSQLVGNLRVTTDEFYLRDGAKTTREEWARRITNTEYTQVAATELDTPRGKVVVSTVWIGANSRIKGEGPPLIFETLTTPSGSIERYATEAEALDGHRRLVQAAMSAKVAS